MGWGGAALATITAMLFVAPVVVQAQTSPSVIYACVNNNSGTIHVIAPNASCNANEIKLQWNVVGCRNSLPMLRHLMVSAIV